MNIARNLYNSVNITVHLDKMGKIEQQTTLVPNPPSAQGLQLDSAQKIVPNQLFNFLAFIITLSSDPLDGDRKQSVVIQDENSRQN